MANSDRPILRTGGGTPFGFFRVEGEEKFRLEYRQSVQWDAGSDVTYSPPKFCGMRSIGSRSAQMCLGGSTCLPAVCCCNIQSDIITPKLSSRSAVNQMELGGIQPVVSACALKWHTTAVRSPQSYYSGTSDAG